MLAINVKSVLSTSLQKLLLIEDKKGQIIVVPQILRGGFWPLIWGNKPKIEYKCLVSPKYWSQGWLTLAPPCLRINIKPERDNQSL